MISCRYCRYCQYRIAFALLYTNIGYLCVWLLVVWILSFCVFPAGPTKFGGKIGEEEGRFRFRALVVVGGGREAGTGESARKPKSGGGRWRKEARARKITTKIYTNTVGREGGFLRKKILRN